MPSNHVKVHIIEKFCVLFVQTLIGKGPIKNGYPDLQSHDSPLIDGKSFLCKI